MRQEIPLRKGGSWESPTVKMSQEIPLRKGVGNIEKHAAARDGLHAPRNTLVYIMGAEHCS
jgi:hypothetical protein